RRSMRIIASSALSLALAGTAVTVRAQAPSDLTAVLTRIGERVADYYKRGQSIVLREKSTVLDIRHDFSPDGFSRVTEYELHVEPNTDSDGAAGGTIVRELLKVNGRVPKPSDRKDRNGCTDSNPVSPEPLAFLLAGNR